MDEDMKMERVEVYVSDKGNVCIFQENDHIETFAIALHPEQVDIVVKWLNKAKEDAREFRAFAKGSANF